MIRGVPYDHQLEYIESTGSQYINTGIVQADNLEVTITYQPVLTSGTVTWGTYFGCGYSDNSSYNILGRHYGTDATDFNPWFTNSTYGECHVPASTSAMNTMTVKSGRCIKDGANYTISSVSGRMRSYTMYLFSANYSNTSWRSQPCRIARFSVSTSAGTKLADYIPVSVNGVAKMYDRVTGTFPKHYGTFVAGPVASTPVMGLHMYGVSDYWFWPKKLVLMPSWSPSSITRPNIDPGLDVWAYRFADNGYAGGVAPDPALISFTSNSVTSENVSGYAEVLFRKFEPGSYKITANRDIPGAVRVLEYAPSGDGYIRSKSILTNISGGGTVAGMFVGKFDVAPHTLTAFQFCSAQRGYQSVPGPCTFTDIHIYDYVQ